MKLLRAVAMALAISATPVTTASVTAGPTAQRPAKPRWQTLPLPPKMPAARELGVALIGGAQIHYAIYGQGDPVVLLHGGLGNADHFAFQLPALIDKFRVIAIDSRGQGRSTRGTGAISYDVMANDVIAVLNMLNIPRASVVGWSDGGEVALKLGIAFPERVDRLFVFAANYDANGSKPRNAPIDTFSRYVYKCKADYESFPGSRVSFRAMADALGPLWSQPTGITRDQLRAIQAPVMMADGDHDEVIVLDQIEEMSHLIPNGQLVVFKDTSHFALWQDPDGFNAAMVDFLTDKLSVSDRKMPTTPSSAAR